tara:strand:- start:1193 stop:1417 length:225 start_codon:yes stop_codon:yes gene_type:complete
MADDEETSDTPWGLIFLGFFMLILAAFFFMGVSAFDQATYQPSYSKPRVFDNMVENLFGSSDLSYKPGASLMSA